MGHKWGQVLNFDVFGGQGSAPAWLLTGGPGETLEEPVEDDLDFGEESEQARLN